ncbi:o-succinylbenzoate synthase [Microbacterium oxydans]|uniref:o-succinylbenzoate synthase n=1 Tax=Microbacterium oxydans TaxID=82380 RepID=A0A0F0LA73_9MICO|nr:o-succinylbenzoate synthase [Microbacterium oxydans]KJL30038.1 o-succinylbenzoate synthase [Microbacterium oxydans]CAH0172411.1 o-succinylbenzoate synthase [Microbacterium oxydans]
MHIDRVELITVRMPLVHPFTTSFSTQTERRPLLVRITASRDGRTVTGWGECVALFDPSYSPEYLDGAREMLRRFLVPSLLEWQDAGRPVTAETVAAATAHVVGHRMAKAALEMAVLDAGLRLDDRRFADHLGVTRAVVPSGVSVGIESSIPDLLSQVGGFLDEGYARIKLKIQPGWDIEPVRAVRERFGDVPLQVDANTAYRLSDAPLLRRLDPFDLLLIEQPLAEDDLRQHALLAQQIATPVCLDESIVSVEAAADAIAMGAASVINIKPGRVGGYLAARRIHDLAEANGIAVWCGGMLETGIGRAANIALAGLPGFTLPGDVSGSNRFYAQDVTAPVVMKDGVVAIPDGPGFGVEPLVDVLADVTIDAVDIAAHRS